MCAERFADDLADEGALRWFYGGTAPDDGAPLPPNDAGAQTLSAPAAASAKARRSAGAGAAAAAASTASICALST